MEQRIKTLLLSLGMMPNLRGFRYLVDSIPICAKADGRLSITKDLYPQVAARHNASSVSVERAIRNAIESLGNNVPMSDVIDLLGTYPSSRSGKFKNTEFIALCALKIGGRE